MTLVIPFFIGLNNPENSLEEKQSFCPLKMATGFPCPSCGITKSLVYSYKGNFEKAIGFHAYGPLVIVFCLFIIVVFSLELKTKKSYFKSYFYNKKIAYFLAITLMMYHTVRLIHFVKDHSWEEIKKESIWE